MKTKLAVTWILGLCAMFVSYIATQALEIATNRVAISTLNGGSAEWLTLQNMSAIGSGILFFRFVVVVLVFAISYKIIVSKGEKTNEKENN